jgi:hypothetical protein
VVLALDDKYRLDQIVDREVMFAHQPAREVIAAHAPHPGTGERAGKPECHAGSPVNVDSQDMFIALTIITKKAGRG